MVMASPIQRRSSVTGSTYINFYKNNQIVASDDIAATDAIYVNYDIDRILPSCGATVNTPNVTVTAYYQIRLDIAPIVLLDTYYQAYIYRNQTFTIPSLFGPGDLFFWFTCTVNGSAPQYDSNNGMNYHFQVNGAKLVFNDDFSTVASGNFKAGEPVVFTYAHARVAKMCPTTLEKPQLTITAFWQFNNQGTIGQTNVYTSYNQTNAAGVNSIYSIEREGWVPGTQVVAGQLALWFSCQSQIASGWDSNFSKNWLFRIDP
ncbi:hypothetical protein HDU76_001705 [Blyttiomyces sp. JEL0837]|nr:hypothetical protein HDU76_001705 [Blyttiomyces sp. JEL0837]